MCASPQFAMRAPATDRGDIWTVEALDARMRILPPLIVSSWILPRIFMPAPWITRILGT